jgi:hypothetical protein
MIDSSKQCIMVVNQGHTTGTDLVDALKKANYRVAGPFRECSAASHWLTGETPRGALLEMLLTDDSCFHLARDLRARGVPYLFHSSTPQQDAGSTRGESMPSFHALLNAMSELIRQSANGGGQ